MKKVKNWKFWLVYAIFLLKYYFEILGYVVKYTEQLIG